MSDSSIVYPDYAAEGVDEREAPRIARRIIEWMVGQVSQSGNFRKGWPWSADQGLWMIATFSAEGHPEWEIVEQRSSGVDSAEARGYISVVALALDLLVDDGLLELDLSFGTPTYRTTMKAMLTVRVRYQQEQREMAARIAALRAMPYPEYLQSPEWLYRRELHVAAASNRCQVCNVFGKLHVHHRTYENRGWERFTDLIALCSGCHQIFHRSGRIVAR